MNQINNIQVGNQTYQIGGTGSGSTTGGGSSLSRGTTFKLTMGEGEDGGEEVFLLARPNEISSLVAQNSNTVGVVTALPHEMLQESGELWNMAGIIPVIVSHDSTDVPGCPHKATICRFIPGDVESSSSLEYILDDMDQILGSLLNVNTMGLKMCIYCSEKFLEATPESTVIIRLCLMDGSVVQEIPASYEMLSSMFAQGGQPSTGDTMVVGFMTSTLGVGPVAIACNPTENPGALFPYSITLNIGSTQFNLYSKSLEPGSMFYDGESEESPVGCILYTGPSYMDVSPVSQYRFNVNMFPDSMLITNIPAAWNFNTPPVFSQDTVTQFQILDGIGTYNTVSLSEFDMS